MSSTPSPSSSFRNRPTPRGTARVEMASTAALGAHPRVHPSLRARARANPVVRRVAPVTVTVVAFGGRKTNDQIS
jgi:hypothetical protein